MRTFIGGIHPPDGKALTENCSIRPYQPKGELVFPLNQHIGAPAAPAVAVGDRVLLGQTIARAQGFVSADICSSVSGTVKAIALRPSASGEEVMCIIIENDGLDETIPGYGEKRDPDTLTADEIRKIIGEAGIVGLGGAGFPTKVKLTPRPDARITHILINAAECEPFITSDYRLIMERGERLITGIRVLLHIFHDACAVIGIEANKPKAIETLEKLVADLPRITVEPLMTKYPQGGERFLIHALTGKKINSTMLPLDAGCIVVNVATAEAIADAVCDSKPLTRRVVTMTGNVIKTPSNIDAPIGTVVRELVEDCGGFTKAPQKVLSGGPMMGTALYSLDIPVTKTTSSILGMRIDPVAAHEPTACIHCGRCCGVCPERLLPQKLMDAADHNDAEAFVAYHGMECVECGSCTYVCPAKRRLTQSFKYVKRTVAAERKKAQEAEKAKAAAQNPDGEKK